MNLLFRIISLTKGYCTALLKIEDEITDVEDIDILINIENSLEKLVRKYNPKWFEPIPETRDENQ